MLFWYFSIAKFLKYLTSIKKAVTFKFQGIFGKFQSRYEVRCYSGRGSHYSCRLLLQQTTPLLHIFMRHEWFATHPLSSAIARYSQHYCESVMEVLYVEILTTNPIPSPTTCKIKQGIAEACNIPFYIYMICFLINKSFLVSLKSQCHTSLTWGIYL
jgi:hypothetical protein